MRINLISDPAVRAIARNLKMDPYAVVGRVHAFWSWADEHTESGTLPACTTREDIDDIVNHSGFAQQLQVVGWLVEADGVLRLPKFDRHNGESAKRRVMDAERKRKQRESAICPQNVTVEMGQCPKKSVTREEKRRDHTLPKAAKAAKDKPPRERNELIDALAALEGALEQTTDPAWSKHAKALSQIKAVCGDLTPDEIKRRAANYSTHFDVAVTSTGLAAHWAKCDQPHTNGKQADFYAGRAAPTVIA